jgi:hypothetical protein
MNRTENISVRIITRTESISVRLIKMRQLIFFGRACMYKTRRVFPRSGDVSNTNVFVNLSFFTIIIILRLRPELVNDQNDRSNEFNYSAGFCFRT